MKLLDKMINIMFAKKEVKNGEIVVLWRDLDGELKAWKANADHTTPSLAFLSAMIENTKQEKFEKIVNWKL